MVSPGKVGYPTLDVMTATIRGLEGLLSHYLGHEVVTPRYTPDTLASYVRIAKRLNNRPIGALMSCAERTSAYRNCARDPGKSSRSAHIAVSKFRRSNNG